MAGKIEAGFAKYTLPIPEPGPTESSLSSVVTTDSPAELDTVSCSISPPTGTVLDAFNIMCKTSLLCSSRCVYCIKTDTGKKVSLNFK